MDDNTILDLYFARDERAVVETDLKYGRYCFRVAQNILDCQEDAEETVSDTYLKAWQSIPPQRPNHLKLFLAKITRNLAFTRWRAGKSAKRGGGELPLVLEELGGCLDNGHAIDDRLKARELARAIQAFLDTLPQRDQDLFLGRYFLVEDTAALAARYGMKVATVNRTLFRVREKLKVYLQKEGYAV